MMLRKRSSCPDLYCALRFRHQIEHTRRALIDVGRVDGEDAAAGLSAVWISTQHIERDVATLHLDVQEPVSIAAEETLLGQEIQRPTFLHPVRVRASEQAHQMIDGLGVAQEGKRRDQSPCTDAGHDIEFGLWREDAAAGSFAIL